MTDMLYTITLNPALDYVLSAHTAGNDPACRADNAAFLPGGKGINVSLMLRRLGVPSVPAGICAGTAGRCLLDKLEQAGLAPDFVHLHPDAATDAGTRINIKLRETHPDGTSVLREINTAGCTVTPDALEELAARLSRRLQPGDRLVLAGSIPPGLGSGAYVRLLTLLRPDAAKAADTYAGNPPVSFAADTAGAGMAALLPLHPWLIKPNRAELAELSGMDISDSRAAVRAARLLQAAGARHVLVTLGADGMLLVPARAAKSDGLGDCCLQTDAIPGRALSSAGAGDASLAGFLAAYLRGWKPEKALRYAAACGAAAAFSAGGMGSRADTDRLYALSALTVPEVRRLPL